MTAIKGDKLKLKVGHCEDGTSQRAWEDSERRCLCGTQAAGGMEMSGEQEEEVSLQKALAWNRCGDKKCLEGERDNLNGDE